MQSEGRPSHPASGRPGRLRAAEESETNRLGLVACHLWPFIGLVTGTLPLLWIGIIVFWSLRKERSPLVDDQGRELLNVLLTLLLLVVIPVIGWAGLIVWVPVFLVNSIRGAIAAGHNEYFRYPLVIRFIT
jgi:uncharacterized Tic20 family protein